MPSSPSNNSNNAKKNPPMYNVKEIHPHDVLCGRGIGMKHVGNHLWRELIRENMEDYAKLPRSQRQAVTNSIVLAVRSLSPPGRFLMLDTKSRTYYDIGDSKANLKTAQAMRDVKKKMIADMDSNNHSIFGRNRRESANSSSDSSTATATMQAAASFLRNPKYHLPSTIPTTLIEFNSPPQRSKSPPVFGRDMLTPSSTNLERLQTPLTFKDDMFHPISLESTVQQQQQQQPQQSQRRDSWNFLKKPAMVKRSCSDRDDHADDRSISSMGLTEHEWTQLWSDAHGFTDDDEEDPLLSTFGNVCIQLDAGDLLLRAFEANI